MSELDTKAIDFFEEESEHDILHLNLISSVKERPYLYDRSDRRYKDRDLVLRAWTQIAADLGLDVDDIKTRWTRLRNNYTKAVARRFPKPGTKPLRRPWMYETEMAFLREHLLTNKKSLKYLNNASAKHLLTTSVQSPSEVHDKSCDTVEEDEYPMQPVSFQVVHQNPQRSRSTADDLENVIRKYAMAMTEAKADEPLVGWFKSLLPTLNTFPASCLMDFQITVMQEMKKLASEIEQEKKSQQT